MFMYVLTKLSTYLLLSTFLSTAKQFRPNTQVGR